MEVPLKPPTKMPNSVLSYRSKLVQNLELTYRIAKEQTQLAQMKMKENCDRHGKPYPYYVGDRVWLYTPKTKVGLSKKLLHCWHGPYRLVEKLSSVTFKLQTIIYYLVQSMSTDLNHIMTQKSVLLTPQLIYLTIHLSPSPNVIFPLIVLSLYQFKLDPLSLRMVLFILLNRCSNVELERVSKSVW